ncbi:MAG: response regulator, partial [Bacteroidales bacterium]|nr:response regulator [Bacteroidales bacterium]
AAPWASWWAITLYSLILIFITLSSFYFRRHVKRNRRLAEMAIFEKEQEKRTNLMNMSFFSNISHEFRTPLTLISGPLEQLSSSAAVKGRDRELLAIIQRSVSRMLKLVNQMMDFNKLENDTLKLQVERADAVSYLKGFLDIFKINAANKDINFVTDGVAGNFICLLDPDKLDKIVNNLLSNALKYTPTGGKVSLSFDVVPASEAVSDLDSSSFKGKTKLGASSYIKIIVSNSGPAIPEELSEKIFERYFQVTESNKGKYNWGTGIGLYYARALALLHHGALFLLPSSEGAAFELLLPSSDDAYAPEEIVSPSPKIAKDTASAAQNETSVKKAETTKDDDKPLLLVVEDDIEVIHYLKTLLGQDYRVIAAYSGEDALPLAIEQHPNLIISDIIMPGMNGYEFCSLVKNDPQLSHIPVILVTAQADMNSQIQGLNTGADAYVTKPFDTKYLSALIHSLLNNRDKLRTILNQTTEVEKVEDMLSGPDKVFMDEFYKLMEKYMSNSEMDIMRITEKMHISRTKFYYKVKALTGHSPATFFKTYKLNRAAELIREGRYNMSEIAYMTGFSTPAHFSTVFKKQFGVSPTAYTQTEDN